MKEISFSSHRLQAETAFLAMEKQRMDAEKLLREAEKASQEAASKLRANEQARDANSRAMALLPGLRELLAPTQEELKLCVETVTNAVMKNAEDSARLLAKLSLTEDPKEALDAAVASRQEGLKQLGFSRQKNASLPGAGSGVTELTVSKSSAATGSSVNESPMVPKPPSGSANRKAAPRAPSTFKAAPSRSAPQSLSSTPRTSMPDKLKQTVGGNRQVALQGASSVSTSPMHMSNGATMRPMPTRRPQTARPTSYRPSPRGPVIPSPPKAGPSATAPPRSTGSGAATNHVSFSCALPPETVPSDTPASAYDTFVESSSSQPTSEGQATLELPLAPKPPAAWETISGVAPNTKNPARAMEKQQKALKKDLAAMRKAMVQGNYGAVDIRLPTAEERVQQRTSRATYAYMMRQRKGREEELKRRAAWESSFVHKL